MGRPCKCCNECCTGTWTFYPFSVPSFFEDTIRYYNFSSNGMSGDVILRSTENCVLGGSRIDYDYVSFWRIIKLEPLDEDYEVSFNFSANVHQLGGGDYCLFSMTPYRFRQFSILNPSVHYCGNDRYCFYYDNTTGILNNGDLLGSYEEGNDRASWYNNGFSSIIISGYSNLTENYPRETCDMSQRSISFSFEGLLAGCYILQFIYFIDENRYASPPGPRLINPGGSFDLSIFYKNNLVDTGNFDNILAIETNPPDVICLPRTADNNYVYY